MGFTDFAVKYDPEKDTQEMLVKRLLRHLFLYRLRANKPSISFIAGDSGEGKSLTVIKFLEAMLDEQGYKLEDYLEDINVFFPTEYPRKLDALLHDKRLKKINLFAIHEARVAIKASEWHSFLNQAIGDVNAMSRGVKRICTFFISQFIKDIDNNIRVTLNYYIESRRPIRPGGRPRLRIYKLWKDTRDLEKPKLRKRKISGYLVYPSGKRRKWTPRYIEVKLPRPANRKKFDELDIASKKKIIKNKMAQLMSKLDKEYGTENKKIEKMVDFYVTNPDNLKLIGTFKRKKFIVKQDVRSMHDLNKAELETFQEKLLIKMKERAII